MPFLPFGGNYTHLGSTQLAVNASVAGSASEVISFPAYDILVVNYIIKGYVTTGGFPGFRFNGDSGTTKYWTRNMTSASGVGTFATSQGASTVATAVVAGSGTANLNPQIGQAVISNYPASTKIVKFNHQQASASSATVANIDLGGGEWVETVNSIWSIQMLSFASQTSGTPTGLMLAGSGFSVYGINLQ